MFKEQTSEPFTLRAAEATFGPSHSGTFGPTSVHAGRARTFVLDLTADPGATHQRVRAAVICAFDDHGIRVM